MHPLVHPGSDLLLGPGEPAGFVLADGAGTAHAAQLGPPAPVGGGVRTLTVVLRREVGGVDGLLGVIGGGVRSVTGVGRLLRRAARQGGGVVRGAVGGACVAAGFGRGVAGLGGVDTGCLGVPVGFLGRVGGGVRVVVGAAGGGRGVAGGS